MVTEENEIRAECVVDAVNPVSFVALYLSPQLYKIVFCTMLLILQLPLNLNVITMVILLRKKLNIQNVTILKKNQRRKSYYLQDVMQK